MSADATTVFRPEAIQRYRDRREAPAGVGAEPREPFALCWSVVLGMLSAALLIRPARGILAGLGGGLVGKASFSPATAATAIGGLVGVAALLAAAQRLYRRRRVPVLLQMSSTDCGAACLAMILSYHGRPTRVGECTEALGAGRDGATARAIAAGARKAGMHVKAYTLAPLQFAHVALPAIVHWQFNHFVVVERWSPSRVEIVDPVSGRRRFTAEEFDRGFTGVTVVCEPGERFQKRRGQRWRWLGQVRAIGVHQPRLLGHLFGASLMLQLIGLALPLLSKVVVDHVVPQHDAAALPALAAAVAGLVVGQAVLGYLRASLLVALRARTEGRLLPVLIERLLALPYRFFEQRRSGDLIARVGSVSLLRETTTAQASSTVLDATLATGYLALVFTQDATMGFTVLGLVCAEAALVVGSARSRRELARRELTADAAAHSYLVEMLSGIATLKASGTEPRAQRRLNGLFAEQIAAARRGGRQGAGVDAALGGLRVLAPLCLLLLGAARVLEGQMTIGTMLATTALSAAALTPLAALIGSAQKIQLVVAHLERLADIVLAAPEQAPGQGRPVDQLEGAVELREVSFRYDDHAPLAIRDVSVAIAPAQKVAIVGRSGSGKSTIAKLLVALYEPTAGTIYFDGMASAGLARSSLRRHFGVVLQEPALFSGSIRDNIAFNHPAASLEQVMEAAELAGIREEIESMPLGYETSLAEAGAGLSGGQRQRLALARAVLPRPALLVLDEATSHLDVVTEARVEHNLSSFGCTRIVIAHRLSTIRDADLILVIDDGRVVERGQHDELLARGGLYTALAAQQHA